MSARPLVGTILLGTAIATGTNAIYQALIARPAPNIATLDIGELYRLKEAQIATLLVKREASDAERLAHLKQAADFATELTTVLKALPQECGCLVLARGALIGSIPPARDLTPDVRRRLGL